MIHYEVLFQYEGKDLVLTHIFPNGKRDTQKVNPEEILEIEKLCSTLWHQSPTISQEIGLRLFNLLNGDTQRLVRALKEADARGEKLSLFIQGELDLPFELLYYSKYSDFLVPHKVHLVRRVSDYAHKKELTPKERPLKILFVACSPINAPPVLDFEKEEEAIFEITQNLPVDIDVEDTGSLQGLKDQLEYEEYDIIHLTGHAGINEDGPYFCMEDEEGFLHKVTPFKLWKALYDGMALPRLIFLSGCRTGQTPHAAFSFAHELVAEHGPPVAGWGLPVTDPAATRAAEKLYHELGRGRSVADAVFLTRNELYQKKLPDWCLLRLFSDGTDLTVPLVKKGQKQRPKQRDIQHTYLKESQVKVLKKGFIGRRRQIQKGIRSLKEDPDKIGLLLHGTGGLGKSCLAGKLCERFKEQNLIIVHGNLNAVTFQEALRTRFVQENDKKGSEILEEKREMNDKINRLCSTSFREKEYLILLDDFEKNLEGAEQGNPLVSDEAGPILEGLLTYLPYAGKMSQVIITSRYTFLYTVRGEDLVKKRLEFIGLTSFQGADERKKVNSLTHIDTYRKEDRQELIEAGRGNPRLMEILDELVRVEKGLDITFLLAEVRGKQDEFVQGLLLKEIFQKQSDEFQMVMRRSACYRMPVVEAGIGLVCEGIQNWKLYVDLGVQLSLMEEDKGRNTYYWVTPLLREELFAELTDEDKIWCHKAALLYYKKVLSLVEEYEPIYAFELVDHALKCGMNDSAVEEGGRLLYYLRNSLAYREALKEGEYIHSCISRVERDEKGSRFLFELGWIYDDSGNPRKAIDYYEQALSIGREVYGERHPSVATRLNNLGAAWYALGDSRKAIEYYEQALSIGREVYGERHPSVAAMLNNLGEVWRSLGDPRKAIDYYEQALSIDREVYGERHPSVATDLNNLGSAWDALGDPRKAIDYYEQALSIGREVYGERHPDVATDLNNLGSAWYALGDVKKATKYFKRAYLIFQDIFGDQHPHTRIVKEWLDNLEGQK